MRIGRFFGRAEADRDQLEQIESYIEIETDENIARGMPADKARAMARRKFGNSALIREEIYRMNTIFLFDALARNVRYGWRALWRNPVSTLAVLLTRNWREYGGIHRSESCLVEAAALFRP